MSRIGGWKVWAFVGLSLALVAAVFLFQADPVSPGAPEVCEEPCDEATEAEAALPGEAAPDPVLEALDPVDPVMVTPVAPVEVQLPGEAPAVERVEQPSADDAPFPVANEAATSGEGPPAEPVQAAEPEPGEAAVEASAAVDGPAGVAVELEVSASEAPGVAPAEESAAQLEAELEAARRAEAAAQAAEPAASMDTPPNAAPGPAVASPTPGAPRLLPYRLGAPTPQHPTPVARGAMGYRTPLVVRLTVPDQILGGVYIPAHDTYVVLRPGHWELQRPSENAAPEALGAGPYGAAGARSHGPTANTETTTHGGP